MSQVSQLHVVVTAQIADVLHVLQLYILVTSTVTGISGVTAVSCGYRYCYRYVTGVI